MVYLDDYIKQHQQIAVIYIEWFTRSTYQAKKKRVSEIHEPLSCTPQQVQSVLAVDTFTGFECRKR